MEIGPIRLDADHRRAAEAIEAAMAHERRTLANLAALIGETRATEILTAAALSPRR